MEGVRKDVYHENFGTYQSCTSAIHGLVKYMHRKSSTNCICKEYAWDYIFSSQQDFAHGGNEAGHTKHCATTTSFRYQVLLPQKMHLIGTLHQAPNPQGRSQCGRDQCRCSLMYSHWSWVGLRAHLHPCHSVGQLPALGNGKSLHRYRHRRGKFMREAGTLQCKQQKSAMLLHM
jgi:hypothetical protein